MGKKERLQKIIDHFDINGSKTLYRLHTQKIKDLGIEPRLIKSSDGSPQMEPLHSLGYSIISIKNREYGIIKANIFKELPDISSEPKRFPIPDHIIKTHKTNFYGAGEARHLYAAFNAGLIDKILGEKFYIQTAGKKRSKEYDVIINDDKLRIEGIQFEIDFMLESENKVCLIETKIKKKEFNIFQLYNPFRAFNEYVNKEKEILLFFVVADSEKNILSFYRYKFNDPMRPLSIELIDNFSFHLDGIKN